VTRHALMSENLFIAVDIGNARIKLGLFEGDCAAGLPEPVRTLPLLGDEPELDQIGPWLADEASKGLAWRIASVNRPAATRLIDWLREHRPEDAIVLLASGDLPLKVELDRPDMVGIDRLVDAVAVNRLREVGCPAVIVDVGTAVTVDLVSAEGVFLGGAILPGIQMAARAMHDFTDLLPLVDGDDFAIPPTALGTATVSAMRSGLFWGTVGAIRQLIEQLAKELPSQKAATVDHNPSPRVFLTGGTSAAVAELIGRETCHVPNLTLAGIAVSTL